MASKYADRAEGDFKINNILIGKSSRYQIQTFLGEGTYSKVAQCIELGTTEKMAVKIFQKNLTWAGKEELAMLKKLKQLDEDKNNLVRFIGHFMHQGHVCCLAFEMLDISLHDLMIRSSKTLHLSEIRVISQQMLVALNALKSIYLVHADIKPDNIMLVNHKSQPFKVKLIDFGLATPVSRLTRGTTIQVIPYRAPEVILGLQLNEAVDMWSLGCVLAFLYLGKHLYPTECEYEVMRAIVLMQGQPNDHLLNSGIRTSHHFSKDQESPNAPWTLTARKQARAMFTSLDDMAKTRPEVKDVTDCKDTQAFLSLLKCILHVEPEKRITPSKALGHHFITTKDLHSNTNDDSYVKSADLTIKDCQLEQSSVKFKHFVTSNRGIYWKLMSITSLDDPLSADEETTVDTNNGPPATAGLDETATAGLNYRTIAIAVRPAAGNNNGPPAKAGLDDTTAAGTDKKPPAASPASVNHATVFVEVKTRKTWFKKLRRFFSRMIKSCY